MTEHTPGPWDTSRHVKMETVHNPNAWTYKQHHFPDAPYEGELSDEWGIYPPLGECGPVALVAGESNARFIVRACNSHYDLLAACNALVEAAEDGAGPFGIHEDDFTSSKYFDAFEKAEAAIDKAEEEK